MELEITDEVIEAIASWVKEIEIRPREELNIQLTSVPSEVQSFINEFVKGSLRSTGHWFSRELQRCHGDISDLERRAADETQLRISLEQSEPRLKLRFREQSDASGMEMSEVEFDISQAKIEGLPWNLVRYIQREQGRRRPSREGLDPGYFDLVELLSQAASVNLFEKFPGQSYYLPAARSGIAQGHKAIASILVRQSSFAALQPLEIPTLSGIITDFISHILTMERGARRRSTSDLNKVIDFLEHQVVQGKIDIEESQEVSYPEISYEPFRGQPVMSKFPFHKTSSMVSELAPVILFLKYLVAPGDLVILEVVPKIWTGS